MLNFTATITTNTTTAIGNPVRARAGQMCRGTVYAQGTFGSGTAALVVSRDGQNTWIPVKDQTGVTASEITSVNRYLGKKWGIAVA